MNQSQQAYLSYLLRLRRVEDVGGPAWRASLESPGSNAQIHFEDLAALWTYLMVQLETLEEKGGAVENTDDI